MAFFTEVDFPDGSFKHCPTAPPPDAFRGVGRGAHRKWRAEREVAKRVQHERCVKGVDDLRDQIMGRMAPKPASQIPLVLPPLPFLRGPSVAMPFFAADVVDDSGAMPFFDSSAFNDEASSGHQEEHSTLELEDQAAVDQVPCSDPNAFLFTGLLTNVCMTETQGDAPNAGDYALVSPRRQLIAATPPPMTDAIVKPALMRHAVNEQLQGSSSWKRVLPANQEPGPKFIKRLEKTASLPALKQPAPAAPAPVPARPAAPVKELLPFSRGAKPQATAWAPHLGARARDAELRWLRGP